ncbi:hypothetical protein HB762_20520 [Vibrio campbellii]|uniref:Uncharacterized protein n=2 Tax=Vibrio campbellii TaxID=680 RepID=A0ABY5ILF0_9VIBR|nr:hypothetical protein [Vibrio campbellii]UTZ33659.1 hypothetical protein HB762_20520 [Vibrio campbellii]
MSMINIILPHDFKGPSEGNLKLCQLFIDSLISSNATRVKFSIDHQSQAVYSNESSLKEVINLIYKTGSLEKFYHQFLTLLHKNSEGQRVLRLLNGERGLEYLVNCKSPLPDLSLEIQLFS